MIRMIRIRKRRLLKKFFLFFTFPTPISSVMQFDACFLSVCKTVIVYRILIILSQKNGLFYILVKSNLFFAAINVQDISQEVLPQSFFYYIHSLLLLRTDMTQWVQKERSVGEDNRSLIHHLFFFCSFFIRTISS